MLSGSKVSESPCAQKRQGINLHSRLASGYQTLHEFSHSWLENFMLCIKLLKFDNRVDRPVSKDLKTQRRPVEFSHIVSLVLKLEEHL